MKYFMVLTLGLAITGCLNASTDDSLLGEDKDGNFVRDDVDKFIEVNFKGEDSISAAKQYAKYFTLRLLNKENRNELLKIVDKLDESSVCYGMINSKKRSPSKDLRKISPKVLNNKLRVLASAKATQTLGVAGGLSKDYSYKYCEFKITGK